MSIETPNDINDITKNDDANEKAEKQWIEQQQKNLYDICDKREKNNIYIKIIKNKIKLIANI